MTTDKKEPWNILATQKYQAGNEIKSRYFAVGTAWPNAKGGFSCQIPTNITLTGDFVILPRKKDEAEAYTSMADENDPIPL